MKTGIEQIAEERQEQITKHGRTIEKDLKNNNDRELSQAAAALIKRDPTALDFPKDWYLPIVRRMVAKDYKQRLVIAGALIAAEIDRLEAKNVY